MQPPFVPDFGLLGPETEPDYDTALIECLKNLRSRENQLFREYLAATPGAGAGRTVKSKVALAYWDSMRSAVRAVMSRCHRVGLDIDRILDDTDKEERGKKVAPDHRAA